MKLLPVEPSEESIGQLAQRRLRESPYFFLKSLECHFADGVLTLRGRVPYAPLKKFAEAIVWRIDGVARRDQPHRSARSHADAHRPSGA